MAALQHIDTPDRLKILGDARRLAILRRLMAGRATLSQLGRQLGVHPAHVRHHLRQLEAAGLVALVSTEVSGGYVEKFYRATADAFLVHFPIVPLCGDRPVLVIVGSHDLALALLAEGLEAAGAPAGCAAVPVGSLDGLIALRQGVADLAGCHLYDEADADYNHAAVRQLFPGEPMLLITVARRLQGLMVRRGNPLGLSGVADLARPGLAFANRQRGSGTRTWLESALQRAGVGPLTGRTFEREAATHLEVAGLVAAGAADAGLGLAAAAAQFDLDFQPLFEERYDLVLPTARAADPLLQALLELLASPRLAQLAAGLPGYDLTDSGRTITVSGQIA